MTECQECIDEKRELQKEIDRLEGIRRAVMENFNNLLMVYRKAINNPDFGILY